MITEKKIRTATLRRIVTTVALATLAAGLAGCAVYTPVPRRVAYVGPAPVVVMHPCCARVIAR